MKGVLDRFEGNLAVILVEEMKEEFTVPVEDLPKGSDVHTYFTVDKSGDVFNILSIDQSTTKEESEKSSDLMAKLRSKSKGSKFKKK